MAPQNGDEKFIPLAKSEKKLFFHRLNVFCHTTQKTHEIIRRNLDKSPMFCGVIEGVGPRYCQSIEDKVTRLQIRSSHQTF